MTNSLDVWLVAVETAHIQSYIFNSNRLKENIGASYLVAAATDTWPRQVVDELTGGRFSFDKKEDTHIEKDLNLPAEIIYAGGGNFVCLFRTQELARTFLRELSRKVLFEAPGLHVIGHIVQYDWNGRESLSAAIQHRLLPELKALRSQQPLNRGLLGLSVTAMCDSTSLPAVTLLHDEEADEHHVYSAEAVAKHVYAAHANKQLADELDLQRDIFRYPLDFDDLGRSKGEKSYVAVVHADGNGMGVLVGRLAEKYAHPAKNREYIKAMRSFSQSVKEATRNAVRATMRILQQSFDDKGVIHDTFNNQALLTLKFDYNTQRWILPFRPLISGGDDTTFVCDGRIGLSLASIYLEQFEIATNGLLL